jgi:hypothetical protein
VGVDGHPGRGPAASGEGGVNQRAAVVVSLVGTRSLLAMMRRPTCTSTSSTRWRLVGAASVWLSALTGKNGRHYAQCVAFAGMSSCASHRATFQSRSAMPWPDHARRRQLP